MILQYFVTEAATDEKIPVEIDKSTIADLETTKTDCRQTGRVSL